MSDISVSLTQPVLSVNFGGNITANFANSVSVNFDTPDLSVNLGGSVTVNFPMGIQFDMAAFIAAINEYDNTADAITAGETYYKASAAHEGAYKGTFIIT